MGTVEISTPSLHKVVGPLAKLNHRFESRHPAKQIYVEVFKSSGDHQISAQNIGVFLLLFLSKPLKYIFLSASGTGFVLIFLKISCMFPEI